MMCSDELGFCDVMCSDEPVFCDVMCSDESGFSPPISGVLLFFGESGICLLGSASVNSPLSWGHFSRQSLRSVTQSGVCWGVRTGILSVCLFVCVSVCVSGPPLPFEFCQ